MSKTSTLPDIAWLESFRAIAAHGSMSQAALHLDRPVQRVSGHIQQLEHSLGISLFFRNTRSMRLTPEGTVYLEHIRKILDDLEWAHGQCSRHHKILRVGISTTLAQHILIPYLHEFYSQSPHIRLDLSFSDALSDLVREGLDVSVRFGAADKIPDNVIAHTLYQSTGGLCAAPAYIAQHGMPQTPTELAQHQCLVFAGSSWLDRVWQLQHQSTQESVTVEIEPYLSSNLAAALVEASLQGMGIAKWKGQWFIQKHLAAGHLLHVLPEYVLSHNSMIAMYPQNRRGSPQVQEFIAFLEGVLLHLAFKI